MHFQPQAFHICAIYIPRLLREFSFSHKRWLSRELQVAPRGKLDGSLTFLCSLLLQLAYYSFLLIDSRASRNVGNRTASQTRMDQIGLTDRQSADCLHFHPDILAFPRRCIRQLTTPRRHHRCRKGAASSRVPAACSQPAAGADNA